MRAELRRVTGGTGRRDSRSRGERDRVVGSLRFVIADTRWSEHCLESTPGPREWLSLQPARRSDRHATGDPRHDLFGEPDRAGMRSRRARWSLFDDAGHATYTARATPVRAAERVVRLRRVRRGRHSARLLVFESFDGGMWEVSVGRQVDPARVRSYQEVAGD